MQDLIEVLINSQNPKSIDIAKQLHHLEMRKIFHRGLLWASR